jgi:hypothetical protein
MPPLPPPLYTPLLLPSPPPPPHLASSFSPSLISHLQTPPPPLHPNLHTSPTPSLSPVCRQSNMGRSCAWVVSSAVQAWSCVWQLFEAALGHCDANRVCTRASWVQATRSDHDCYYRGGGGGGWWRCEGAHLW